MLPKYADVGVVTHSFNPSANLMQIGGSQAVDQWGKEGLQAGKQEAELSGIASFAKTGADTVASHLVVIWTLDVGALPSLRLNTVTVVHKVSWAGSRRASIADAEVARGLCAQSRVLRSYRFLLPTSSDPFASL